MKEVEADESDKGCRTIMEDMHGCSVVHESHSVSKLSKAL